MSRTHLATIVLILAVLAACTLRAVGIMGKRTINHDGGISYLSAAGKQGKYQDLQCDVDYPFGTWVPAAEIKQLLQPEKLFCFGQIGRDLAETDIHPPLYFWLLHVWCLVFGAGVWTGPALNVVIACVTIFVLFGFARFLLRDDLQAALVAGIWALSPAVIETCFEARHYDLLALCTIAFVWATLRCANTDGPLRRRDLLALALTTAAGALTHYHFALIAAACGLFLVVRLAARDGKRLIRSCLAMGAGVVLFFLLHPHFYQSLLRGRKQAQPFDSAELISKLQSTILCYSTFFVSTPYNKWIVHKYFPYFVGGTLLALAAFVVLLMCLWARVRRDCSSANATAPALDTTARAKLGGRHATEAALRLPLSQGPAGTATARGRQGDDEAYLIRREDSKQIADRNADHAALYASYFFFCMAAANAVLYLAAISPRQAMGPMYLAMVWPFLAFVVVIVLRQFGRAATALLLLFCCGMLGTGALGVHRFVTRWSTRPDPAQFLKTTPAVMADNLARGILPGIVWHVPDDRPTLAASQEYLLENRELWVPRMRHGGVYVSELAYGNSDAGRAAVLRLLSEEGRVTPVEGGVLRHGRVWVVEPRSSRIQALDAATLCQGQARAGSEARITASDP